MKIHGLINNLHGEYFPLEPYPFGGSPSTVINQNQVNKQEMNVVISDIKEKIEAVKGTYAEVSKERLFLEELEKALHLGMSFAELMVLCYKIGEQIGLSISQIRRLGIF